MTDVPLVVRIVILSVLVSLLSLTGWAGQDVKGLFEVGQQWEFQHEGPRPGSFEPNNIDGERIIHVIGAVEEPEGKQWIIEDRFTADEKAAGRLYVNQKRLLTTIEFENEKGEKAKLRYDSPIPYQIMEMNIDQEKTIETSLKMDSADFTLPSTMVIQRLDDETITTPAGEFVDCWHFIFKTKSVFNIKIAKIPMTEERERWYHPKVNGLVKEVYRKDPVKFLTWSRKGYTATSILTAYGKKDVPADIKITSRTDNTSQNKESLDQSQTKASRFSATHIISLGTTILLVSGIYVLRKRKRRNALNV